MLKGNKKIRNNELRENIIIKPGDIFIESNVLLDERSLRDLYIKKGFMNATITNSFVESEDGIKVIYFINEGASTVIETVFENRFMHVSQLGKMGASIDTAGNKANIKGNAHLRGCQVMATDLRDGAALVLAGLVADGKTEISEIYHIERGYEKFIEKFEALGATITRVDD